MIRRAALFLALLTSVVACSRRQPPPPVQPPPTQTTTTTPPRTAPDTAGEGARRAAAEAAATTRELRGTLEAMILFDYDDSRIRADQEGSLNAKAPILRANPNVALLVTGHADERGSGEYNLALGLRRANAVRDFLTSLGIDGSRISTDTMGEDRPLDTGTTEAAYARNRRAETAVARGGDVLVRPGR